MKNVLALIAAAKKNVEAARKKIDSIKDEDLKFLPTISREANDLKRQIWEADFLIRKKQCNYFHLLARCMAEVKPHSLDDDNFAGYTLLFYQEKTGKKTEVQKGTSKLSPDGLPLPVYIQICEVMIQSILDFPHQQNQAQQLIDERIEALTQLRQRILEIPLGAEPKTTEVEVLATT